MKNILFAFLLSLLAGSAFAQSTPPGSSGNLITNYGGYQYGAIAVGNTLTEAAPTTPATINVTQKLPRYSNLSTDTVLSTDYGVSVNYTGSGVAVTLPSASSSNFFAGFSVTLGNFGSGLVTPSGNFVTPYGTASSFSIPVGMSCYMYSDGTSWQVAPESCPPINLIPHGYTVATLPAGISGWRLFVTDASSCTLNGSLTGGGSVKCPVWYNGSAWVGD